LAKEAESLLEPMAKFAETPADKTVKESIRKQRAGCGA